MVILVNFSPKMKNANTAVIKGIKLIVKTVLATVVEVIDKIKHTLEIPNTNPANHPYGPTFVICNRRILLYLINRYKKMAEEKAKDR